MSKKKIIDILVHAIISEDVTKIEIGYGNTNKKSQPNIENTAMILAQAISLLIKTSGQTETGIKDYELMGIIREYLDSEFINNKSFVNAGLNYEKIK